jgi:glycerol-3-phosphate dehydrogenase (NAD+)
MMLTCFGSLSRNRTVGKRLGQGEKLEDILASMTEVAEGVATSAAAVQLAEKYELDLPIIKAVASVLAGKVGAREAVEKLMSLPVNVEDTWADLFVGTK